MVDDIGVVGVGGCDFKRYGNVAGGKERSAGVVCSDVGDK